MVCHLFLLNQIPGHKPASVLVGMDVLSGLTKPTINMIVENHLDILVTSVDDIQILGGSFEFASAVYNIVSKYNEEI